MPRITHLLNYVFFTHTTISSVSNFFSRLMGNKYILLDVLLCSIAEYFYELYSIQVG